MQIRAIDTSNEGLQNVLYLLNKAFNKNWDYKYINWLYNENPDGKVFGFNAFKDDRLIAHYATIPIKAEVFGSEECGLLSLNTATHPDHMGKGLFTTLANETYRAAQQAGYQFVVGVANSNSTPGFLKRLDFEHVCSLEAMIGWGSLAENKLEQDFIPIRCESKKHWRLRNPYGKYFTNGGAVYSRTDNRHVSVVLSLNEERSLPEQKKEFTLLLGTNDNLINRKGIFFRLPNSLKPSPLNLIHLDLSGTNRSLIGKKVNFGLFDFDAY